MMQNGHKLVGSRFTAMQRIQVQSDSVLIRGARQTSQQPIFGLVQAGAVAADVERFRCIHKDKYR